MTPCQVSGFFHYICFFILSEVKRKYSFKVLENAKNSKRSKFVRELSLCGSNDHSFEKPSQNNEKIFEVVQIRKL
jgi:hypothetical protein